MKVGEVYVCEECGLELQVVKACEEHHKGEAECACAVEGFACCGGPLKLKSDS
jgi:hypothetical protein